MRASRTACSPWSSACSRGSSGRPWASCGASRHPPSPSASPARRPPSPTPSGARQPLGRLHQLLLDGLGPVHPLLGELLFGPRRGNAAATRKPSAKAASQLLNQSQHHGRNRGAVAATSSPEHNPGAVSATSGFWSARPPLLCVVVEEGLGPGHGEESVRGGRRVAKFERTAVHCQGTSCLHEDRK